MGSEREPTDEDAAERGLAVEPTAERPAPAPSETGSSFPGVLGAPLALAGALLLVVSLLLVWYTVDPERGAAGAVVARTGWEAFDTIDVLISVVAAVGAIAAVVGLFSGRASSAAGTVAVIAGVLAAALVTYRMIDEPGADAASDLEVGPFLALAAAVMLVGGGLLMLDRLRVRPAPIQRSRRPRPTEPAT